MSVDRNTPAYALAEHDAITCDGHGYILMTPHGDIRLSPDLVSVEWKGNVRSISYRGGVPITADDQLAILTFDGENVTPSLGPKLLLSC